MVMKTLEHYAVNRLEELESENEILKDKVNSLYMENMKLCDSICFLRNHTTMDLAHCATYTSKTISLPSFWEKHEKGNYDRMIQILGLQSTDKELDDEIAKEIAAKVEAQEAEKTNE